MKRYLSLEFDGEHKDSTLNPLGFRNFLNALFNLGTLASGIMVENAHYIGEKKLRMKSYW